MTSSVLSGLGGLGLFLLGMAVMTDGLKEIAGGALGRALRRFTRSPGTGVLTGAGLTALVQSSSATTVAAVGFVGSGLLGFREALGILFGANIGTTVTGWLVALFGFKLPLGELALLFVFAGAALKILARGRTAAAGFAVAGFGLVFVGLDFLQGGLSALEGVVTPASFPPDTVAGRLLLVLIGVGITLVTQSSSAGVATAMTALHAGTISFPQAAAMVVGMDVGTTVTALLAATGGTLAARRTGWAHVVYNVLTGVVAFWLVPLYAAALARFLPGAIGSEPEIALVGFHTLFNTLGVVAVMPFVGGFARLIVRLVPARRGAAAPLEEALLDSPAVAVEAVVANLRSIAARVAGELAGWLAESGKRTALGGEERELVETRGYLVRLRTPSTEPAAYRRHVACLHALDHLESVLERAADRELLDRRALGGRLGAPAARLAAALEALAAPGESPRQAAGRLTTVRDELAAAADSFRQQSLAQAVDGSADADATLGELDAHHWLERVAHHAARIAAYLAEAAEPGGPSAAAGRTA